MQAQQNFAKAYILQDNYTNEEFLLPNFSRVKIWIDREKKMFAIYDDRYCIDIFLEKEDASENEVVVEYWDKDKLVTAVTAESGELGSLQDLLEIEENAVKPTTTAKIKFKRKIK